MTQANTTKELKESILSPYREVLENLHEAYIFGTQKLGEKINDYCLKRGIRVKAFVDNDKKKRGKEFCGKRILAPEELPGRKDCCIIIGSLTYAYDIQRQLNGMGFKNVIDYPVLSLFDRETFRPEGVFDGMLEDLLRNRHEYELLYSNLGDAKSKNVLSNLVKFRTTLKYSYLEEICDPDGDEYFDTEIITLDKNEAFADCGGYTGDTTLKFIARTGGNYAKIFFFEPDSDALNEAKRVLQKYGRIKFFHKGVFSMRTTLSFSSGGGSGSRFAENGNEKIQVVSLDESVNDRITFIKIDVEGVEEDVLCGAVNHIKSDSAKLAIAGYHKPDDIWKIPKVLAGMNENYRFYLRQYTANFFDTIIYCVPG